MDCVKKRDNNNTRSHVQNYFESTINLLSVQHLFSPFEMTCLPCHQSGPLAQQPPRDQMALTLLFFRKALETWLCQ